MNNKNKYVVIIGDIINSKKIENRSEVQDKFITVLNKVNEVFKKDVVSNFIVTVGDEFQGLIRSEKDILDIIEMIDIAMYPVRIRYGIGVGTISSQINKEKSNEVDGPAYHKARQMLTELEKDEQGNKKPTINIKISSSRSEDKIMNACFALLSTLKLSWTARQAEIIYAYIKNDYNQHLTASALKVQQSTINRSLNASNYYSYSYAQKQLKQYLKEEVSEDE